MPTGYSWLTLTTALTQFQQRLNTDFSSPNSYWKQAEAIIYIQQSLRFFNSLTYQNKTNFVYNSPNLWNSLGSLTGSPRLRTLTDTYAYQQIEYMLLEPASGGTWTGTSQFNIAQITQALQSRRDEMIQVSNCNLSLMAGIPSVPNTRRTFLPDTVIDVPRLRFGTETNPSLGLALAQNQVDGSGTGDFSSSFSGVGPYPVATLGECAPGDIFDTFVPSTGVNINFYDSSLNLLQSNVILNSSSFTTPSGTAFYSILVANPIPGNSYFTSFHLNTIANFGFFTGPDAAGWTTSFSGTYPADSVTDYNIVPIGSITPGSVLAITLITDPSSVYVVRFYDSNLNLISSTAATSAPSFTVPTGSAYWSMGLSTQPGNNPQLGVTYTISFATIVSSGCPTNLYRDDTVALEFYESPLYQIPAGTPQTYQMSAEPPLSFDVDIVPDQPGTYEAIVLLSGTPLNPPASTLLGIPDDCVWTLIWGALADLLGRESEATDRQRAAYALKRYQDGLVLLQKTPWIMLGSVNGVACTTDSIYATDRYMPGWDCSPATFGPCIVTGGIDFLAAPINAGIGLTVLGNMPVPSAGGDFLQISRSDWDTVLDLAQCLAAWKQGGAEFEQALELEQRAIQACAAENTRLQSFGAFSDILLQRGQDQERNLNRYNSKGKG